MNINNTSDHWVRADGAFEPIIPATVFAQAQAKMANWTVRRSDQELIRLLAEFRDQTGGLSAAAIDASPTLPSLPTYRRRFGNLQRAYALVGQRPIRDLQYLERRQRKREVNEDLLRLLRAHLCLDDDAAAAAAAGKGGTLLSVQSDFAVRVATAFVSRNDKYPGEWTVRTPYWRNANACVVARISEDDFNILDYFVFPSDAFGHRRITFRRKTLAIVENYRCDTFDGALALLGQMIEP